MLYETHEVIGTDLPVYKKKDNNLFTLEDIMNTNQTLENFNRCGFVKTFKYERTLYIPVYKRKGE